MGIPQVPRLSETIRGVRNIAAATGINHEVVRAALRDGSLPKLQTGRTTIVLVDDVNRWLESLRDDKAAS